MPRIDRGFTLKDLLGLISRRYADKPDDFKLSVGHFERPDPNEPVSIYNLPEFCGYVSIEMADIRAWIESDPATARGGK